eukprot:TRINITY_DN2698_c1_g3_i2.p1 TRINITY_DN2698_c1_g3~~TRINITY_DN2698_c1_g3_i2.p1  ORF type:complete len:242 (-),score=17.90 TRINITY_DN2698_c1_g3_i2:85-810(-)
MSSNYDISISQEEKNEEFGMAYKQALQKLTELQTHNFEESKKLGKEVDLLLEFAELVPERITLIGFQDLITKMSPNILIHRDKYLETALHRMARTNNVMALNVLLNIGPKDYREMIDEDGCTALYAAAAVDKVDCIKALLKDSRPEYREIINEMGETALLLCAFRGNVYCIQALLKDSRPEYREIRDKVCFSDFLFVCVFLSQCYFVSFFYSKMDLWDLAKSVFFGGGGGIFLVYDQSCMN